MPGFHAVADLELAGAFDERGEETVVNAVLRR